MKTNELKKGTEIKLACGWYAELMDNARGNTRMTNVHGYFTEIGSVYAHDIVSARVDGQWVSVEHTPAQLKLKNIVGAW